MSEGNRLWWQKRLKIGSSGVQSIARPGWYPLVVEENVARGAHKFAEMVKEGQDYNADHPEQDIAACLMFAAHKAANPKKTDRELLGLPTEEPAPLTTKSGIAAALRREAEINPFSDTLKVIALAVESLPEPEPAKVSPFAAEVAKRASQARDDHENPLGEHDSAALQLSYDCHYALSGLLRDHDAMLSSLVDLASTCQRAAEDLGLCPRE